MDQSRYLQLPTLTLFSITRDQQLGALVNITTVESADTLIQGNVQAISLKASLQVGLGYARQLYETQNSQSSWEAEPHDHDHHHHHPHPGLSCPPFCLTRNPP